MKARWVSFLIVTAIMAVPGCGASQRTFNPPRIITGQIMVVGNEPFTRIAVLVSSDKSYLITCDDNTKQLLLRNQGKNAKLVYDEIRKTNRGEELRVLSVSFGIN